MSEKLKKEVEAGKAAFLFRSKGLQRKFCAKFFVFFSRSPRVGLLGALLSGSTQPLKGSPVRPGRQLHMGRWLTTRHCAPRPQEPGQGSAQVSLTQACVAGQSVLTRHCGRHCGGLPTEPGWHEHTAKPATSRQRPRGPQGGGVARQGGGLGAGGGGGAGRGMQLEG